MAESTNPSRYKPGKSGNKIGAPIKERALTRLIERAMSETIVVDDKRTARKRVMAKLLAQVVSEGYIEFPDGRKEIFTPKEWSDFVMKVLAQVDGPPRLQVDADVNASHSGSIEVRFVPRPPTIQDTDDAD